MLLALLVVAIPVFAASGSAPRSQAKRPAADQATTSCTRTSVKPAKGINATRTRAAATRKLPAKACAPKKEKSPNIPGVPNFVPAAIAAELGDPERNGGRHDWARLGNTLGANASFVGDRGTVRMRMLNAPSGTRRDFENGAVYNTTKYSAVQTFVGETLKESIVIPKRLGKRTWSWQLTLPKGKQPRLLATGGLDLGIGLTVPKPLITDSKGRTLKGPAAWSFDADGTIWIDVNDATYPTPYVVDPGLEPEVAFTGFTSVSGGNAYIDPAFQLTRMFVNTNTAGTFTANAVVNDPENDAVTNICFPGFGAGWTPSTTACTPNPIGLAPAGVLATYYSGSGNGGAGAFTTTNRGSSCTLGASPVGPFSRIEPYISSGHFWGNLGWATADAPYTELCDDTFSARWQGQIRTGATAGAYHFATVSDDGAKVWIEITPGTWTLVTASWGEQSATWVTGCPTTLNANTDYNIRVEYYENAGGNQMQLRWRQPGGGAAPPSTAAYACRTNGPVTSPATTRVLWGINIATPWAPTGTVVNPGGAALEPTSSASWPAVPTLTAGVGLHLANNQYQRTYTWNAGANTGFAQTQDVTAQDDASGSGSAPFTVIPDTTGPSRTNPLFANVNIVSYPANGRQNTTAAVRLNWSAIGTTDGVAGDVSGIDLTTNPASPGRIVRQETTLAGDLCGAWPATWNPVAAGNSDVGTTVTPASTGVNDIVTGGALIHARCYRWGVVFKDNVGNFGATITQELKVDTTAPTGTVAVTEAPLSPYMFVNGSTIYFNNGPQGGASGSLAVDVDPVEATTGIASVSLPALGAGWSPATAQTPASPYLQSYTWNASAIEPGAKSATVTDLATNASVAGAIPYTVLRDVTAPMGMTLTYPNTIVGIATQSIGWNMGVDGTGAGLATAVVQRDEVPMNPDGSYPPFPGTFGVSSPTYTALPTNGTWAQTLIAGTCYQYRITATDKVGNFASLLSPNVLCYDDQPPAIAFAGITTPSAGAYRQPLTNTVWYRPSTAGSFRLTFTATDAIAMAQVDFPALGAAGWTDSSPLIDTTAAAGNIYESQLYSWAAGASNPAAALGTATDSSGNTATAAFDIEPDSIAPTGTVNVTAGTQGTTAIAVAFSSLVEAGSGVSSWALQYQSGTLANGVCTPVGGWNAGPSGAGTPPASISHTGLTTGCYQYRILLTDNVGNAATSATSSNWRGVDLAASTMTVTSPAGGSNQSGTLSITGTGVENHSALVTVMLTYTGPSSGTACATATIGGSAPNYTFTCSWATSLLPDGMYTVTVTGTDAVGNIGTTTTTVRLDNVAPVAAWTSWTENSAYLYADTGANRDRLWYHPTAPAGAATATATVTATDAGVGMQDVQFPSLGAAGWSGSGSVPAPAPLNKFAFNYTFTGGGAIGDPALNNATARDLAGAATGAPALNFRIDPDNDSPVGGTNSALSGIQSTTAYSTSATVGTDASSGVGSYAVDRAMAPMVDGACGAWDPWSDGFAGTLGADWGNASNGSALTLNHRLNDPDGDLVPNWNDSFCLRVRIRVRDNVNHETTIAENGVRQADFSNPVSAITSPAAGSGQSGTFSVDGTASDAYVGSGVEYPLSGSGLQDVTVSYLLPDGPDADALPDASGTVCTTTTFGGAWTAATWSCPWITNALPDGTYTVSAQARDNSGRVSTISTRTFLLDNQAPVITWNSWNEYANPYLHAMGNVAWANPGAPAGTRALDARVTSYDLGSGVATVGFPALGAGWAPAGGSNATGPTALPAANSYTLAYGVTTPPAPNAPGIRLATATDGAGNSSTASFEVRLDANPPSAGSTSVVAGAQSTSIVTVSMVAGVDGAGESGMADWRLEYDTAPLADDICGAFTNSWSSVISGVGSPPASTTHDVTTAIGSGCYRYRLRQSDNVSNQATSAVSTNARRVDLINPTVAITSPATATSQSGTVTVTGTAGDAHSGVDHVRLAYSGTATGTICDPAALGGASPAWTYSCAWVTNLLADGPYTVTATSYDRAGRVSTVSTINLVLDNQPPFIGFHSFAESTPYTYWAGVGTPLWFNPSAPPGTYSFDVRVYATDLGSGVDRVQFGAPGAGWTTTPATGIDTTPAATPVPDSYTMTYTFDPSSSPVDPPALQATAYDPANNPNSVSYDFSADNAAPNAGTISYAGGFNASTSMTVTLATGGDGAGSGVASWELLRANGTLSGGSCIAWGAYSVSVATGTGAFSGTRTDTTLTDPGCARYQLRVTDNVGNVGQFNGVTEVMVDLTPPTGTLALTEGTNPQNQFLATPTRLFVNTNAGSSGTFDVAITAAAASGVLDVAVPTLAAGFSAATTYPGPGAAFPHTYSWTGPAGAPPAGRQATIRSNSLGALNLPFEVISDAAAPTGAAVGYSVGFTGGYNTTGTTSVTYSIGSDGTGAGIRDHQLERENGTLAAGICTWSGTWATVGALSGPLTQADTVAHATCARYRVRVTDQVANIGYSPISLPVMVDTTAPTGASLTITEGGNPGEQYVPSGSVIWVKGSPTAGANFVVTVAASDPESGTGTATFPLLGSTFAAPASGGPYTATYGWSAGVTNPVSPNVLVANGAGATLSVPFTVNVDSAAPAGGTLDQQNGFDTNYSLDLSFTQGTESGSGLATWRIERRMAIYNPGTSSCGLYAAWGVYPLPVGQPASPYIDTAVAQPRCYQYRLIEIDNVGNQATTLDGDTGIVIDDIFPPAAFNLNLPAVPTAPIITTAVPAPSCTTIPTYASLTPNITWAASSDAESGLAEYRVYVDGTGTEDAIVAAPTTSWSAIAQTDGSHTLGVRAYDNQGNTRDAGPAFPATVRFDGGAPTASIVTPAAASWTGTATPLLDWTAADANCLASVDVYVDNLATPIASASGTEGSMTSPTLSSGMHTWQAIARDSLGNATTAGPVSFGVDLTAPTAFNVLTPTASQTVRGFLNLSWTAATDADSGLATASGYRVYLDGSSTPSATVAAGVTSTTVPGITAGAHTVLVRATDAVGNFTNTTPVSFTGYGAIPVPTLITPAANARINAVPTLDWDWVTDGGPAPTDYDVIVDGAVVANELHPVTVHTLAALAPGNHTWSITQHDPYTGTVSSVVRTFLLDITAPVNAGPLTRVATTISWPAASDPAAPVASGINRIEFIVDDGVLPPTTTNLAAGATSRNYGALPDGNYTMSVRAVDNAGNATTAAPMLVTNDSQPPTAFALTPPAALSALPAITAGSAAPACESALTYATATPTLAWAASSDATSGLKEYDVVIDGVTVTTIAAPTTTYTVATPLAGGAHTWSVIARDNFGQTRASTPTPMNVRVDGVSPTVTQNLPGAGTYTASTTPTLTWSSGDDNCAARVELTLDGSVVHTFSNGTASYTVPGGTPLAEGAHTWSLRAFDSVGNITSSGAPRTFNVDTTPPTGVTAIFPTNAGSAPEQMMTFQWGAASDTGSGVDHYDLYIDGVLAQAGVTATTRGTYRVIAGPHTWSIRAYDAVGNWAPFNFTFTATVVPDVTAPNTFNLLTPTDGASTTAATPLTWEPSWDFQGVTGYRVFIDGALAGTTLGNVTTFTPTVGAGSPICTAIDYDPSTSTTCITGPTYTNGEVAGGATTPAVPASSTWNLANQSGYSASGNAFGFGDASITPATAAAAGFDGDRMWTAAEYSASIPAGGADLRFEHRYRTHMNGQAAYDGGTVELMVDTAGDGFANDNWKSTCSYGTRGTYGTSIACDYEIVAVNGGYNAVLGGPAANHPLAYRNVFAGDPGGVVQTKVQLSGAVFAGKNIRFRFRLGTDSCYSGMPANRIPYCPNGIKRAVWRIDNVTLANPSLLPGPHLWYVEARDAAGNVRPSNQTWTFNLT